MHSGIQNNAAYIAVATSIFVLMSFTFLFPCNKLIPLDRRTIAAVCAVLCYLTRTYLFANEERIDLLSAIDFDVLILLASIMIINHIVIHLKETKNVVDYLQTMVIKSPLKGFWLVSFAAFVVSPFLTNDGVCLLFVEPIISAFEKITNSDDNDEQSKEEHQRKEPAADAAERLHQSDAIYFLLALACSTNIGSALTYTGNPQNMIVASDAIRVMPSVNFLGYMILPSILSWLMTIKWIEWCWMSSRKSTRAFFAVQGATTLDDFGLEQRDEEIDKIEAGENPTLGGYKNYRGNNASTAAVVKTGKSSRFKKLTTVAKTTAGKTSPITISGGGNSDDAGNRARSRSVDSSTKKSPNNAVLSTDNKQHKNYHSKNALSLNAIVPSHQNHVNVFEDNDDLIFLDEEERKSSSASSSSSQHENKDGYLKISPPLSHHQEAAELKTTSLSVSPSRSGPQSPLLSPRQKRARERAKLLKSVIHVVTSPVPYLCLVLLGLMIIMIFVDIMPISGLICVTSMIMVVCIVVGNHWRNRLIWSEPSTHSHQSNGHHHHRRNSSKLSHTNNNSVVPYNKLNPINVEEKRENLNEFFESLFNSIDYSLLVIFVGTFVVVENMSSTGVPKYIWDKIVGKSQPFATASSIIGISAFVLITSQFLGNVAVVQLAKPNIAVLDDDTKRFAWALVSFVATVGGNLTITGSAGSTLLCRSFFYVHPANIIVAEKAARLDASLSMDFFVHYKVCFWVTLFSCLLGGAIITLIVQH